MILPQALVLAPWNGLFSRAPADDVDGSSQIVEVELEALESDVEVADGRVLPMWTYNGVVPGPRIEARVGDLVRVHFRNSLPESTTIHWHGLRVPAAMDGALVAQPPIEPGEEFTYEFRMLDAGTFWYHPHIRGDEQVERGLYGAFVVHAQDEPNVSSERVVVLDDLLVDREWRLAPFDPAYAMIGRQGNVLLANGRAHPIVDLSAGGIHRFRFVNAANARYFRLALPGYRVIQIGADGGRFEAPLQLDELLLVPGERADVLVQATATAPNTVDWQTLSYERGHGTGVLPDAPVFQVRQTDYDASKVSALPTWFEPLPELASPAVSRELRLSEGLEGSAELRGSEPDGVSHAAAEVQAMHAGASDGEVALPGGRELRFAINGVPWPDSPPLVASLGAVEEWSIVNGTEMDHPFHLHGFRFQVLSEDGQPPAARVWRDTINVRAQTTTVFRVRLEEYPGRWMFHCHIQEHAERGMMGELLVEATD